MSDRVVVRTGSTLAFLAVFLFSLVTWAASPDANDAGGTPLFRVTSGEVHVAITVVASRNQSVPDLSLSDFMMLRDGVQIDQIVSWEKHQQMPLTALVMTDISESMSPGLELERSAARWLQQNATPADSLQFLDFGADVHAAEAESARHSNVTSLYDSLVTALPRIPAQGTGRHALILLSDGDDNSSDHVLEDAIELAQERDIAVYAITARPSKEQYFAEADLRELTENTGGRFYLVRNAREMDSALADIHTELTNSYELVFRSDSEKPGLHQLSIRPVNHKLHLFCRTAYFQPGASDADSTR